MYQPEAPHLDGQPGAPVTALPGGMTGGAIPSHLGPHPPAQPPPQADGRKWPPYERRGREEEPPGPRLWVGNLSPTVTEKELMDRFGPFGPLDSVFAHKERNFAYVQFRETQDAEAAKNAMNGASLYGQAIRIEYAKSDPNRGAPHHRPPPRDPYIDRAPPPRGPRRPELGRDPDDLNEPSPCLWIGFPPDADIDEMVLRGIFGRLGEIDKVRSFPNRPYAFVQFFDTATAMRAREQVRKYPSKLNDPRVSIRFSKQVIGEKHRGNDSGYRRPREYESAGPDPYYPDPLSPNKRPRTGGPYDSAPADYGYGAPPPGPSLGQPGAPPGFGAPTAYGAPEAPGYPPTGPIIWHGTLAKSGTTVCKARCFAIGKAPEVLIPETVNCTARTDLDTLARHVYTIADYNVVCFEPETAEDQPPYHDFLRYLGDKRRAGVAKWGDGGATLFLVPPSDFSTDVLKVPGADRLLGVVMTFRSTQFAPPLQAPLPPQPPPGPPPLRATGPHPPAGPPPIHAQPSYAPQPAYPPLPPGRPSAPPVQSQGAAPPNPLATVSPEVLQALSALIPQLQSQGGVQAGNPLLGLLSAALAGGGAAAAGGYGQSPGTAAPGPAPPSGPRPSPGQPSYAAAQTGSQPGTAQPGYQANAPARPASDASYAQQQGAYSHQPEQYAAQQWGGAAQSANQAPQQSDLPPDQLAQLTAYLGGSQPAGGQVTPQQQPAPGAGVNSASPGYGRGQQPGEWNARPAKPAVPAPPQGGAAQGQAEGGAQEEKQFEQQLQQAFLLLQQIQQQQGPES